MSKAIQHFITITKHRHAVIKHCFKAGIGFQGLFHDLSKYSPTEFIPGAKYYQGTRSPNEAEREDLGFSRAWMHHKGRNKHHFEYWTDYDFKTKTMQGMPMPDRYLIEMFCDRVAASKIYQGKNYRPESSFEYFDRGRNRRGLLIHPYTSERLEFLLRMLKDEGEEKTFKYIRTHKNSIGK
ncbi:MAG: DUF5662 family protein [Lachnospiraceae bacterium]|nr:DUF5662 family protein [Lachnospiraceae bacterium]